MVNQGLFAENVRRAAGAHLISLDRLAAHVGVSRQAMMKLVAHKAQDRSLPSSETALKIAEAFAVDMRDLNSEPADSLRAVVEAFEDAPIRASVKVPESALPFKRPRPPKLRPPKLQVEMTTKSTVIRKVK